MIKIKFPKKISENKIKDFFVKQGLGYLIPKKSYYIDGYKVSLKDVKNKKKDKKGIFDIRITKKVGVIEERFYGISKISFLG